DVTEENADLAFDEIGDTASQLRHSREQPVPDCGSDLVPGDLGHHTDEGRLLQATHLLRDSCEADHGQPPSAGDGVVQFVSASFDGGGGYAIGGVADVEDDQVEVLVNQPLLGCGEVLLGLEVDLPEVCELLGQHFAKVRDHLGVVIDYEHPIRNVG